MPSRINRSLIALISIATQLGCSSGITKLTSPHQKKNLTTEANQLIVDLNHPGKKIERSFYGSQLDPYSSPPPANLVKNLKLGRIRVGGNEYDVYNWKTSIALTKNGLIHLPDFNTLTPILSNYDVEGIFQVNLQGFQPEYDHNHYVLKPTFQSKDAYEMIKNLNDDKHLRMAHWSLGNEFEQWHETHPHTLAWSKESGISADEYIQRFIQFALALRTAQEEINGDPNKIQIWGPEISASWLDWNTGNFDKDCKWSDNTPGQVHCSYGQGQFDHFIPYFLDRLRKAELDPKINPKKYRLLDYLSFHYYPNFRTKISDPNSVITDLNGQQWVEKMLESTRVLHDSGYVNTIDLSSYKNFKPDIFGRMKQWRDQYYPKAKLALNEFAIDSDYRSNSYHPIVRPLYTADAIGIAATHDIDFFNNFVLNNPSRSPVPWTLLEGGSKPTNAYHMYSLFTEHFVGQILSCDDSLNEKLNCYSTINDDNLVIAVVNKDPLDVDLTIKLRTQTNQIIGNYKAPGWSTSILKFKRSELDHQPAFEVFRYGAEEMGIKKLSPTLQF